MPLHWSSRLQSIIALSTTEAEFVALSEATREITPYLNFLKEVYSRLPDLPLATSQPVCTLFEDNKGAIALATVNRYRSRTKHIGLKYHHFRDLLVSGSLKIRHITSELQLADIFTKPLKDPEFPRLRKRLLGW